MYVNRKMVYVTGTVVILLVLLVPAIYFGVRLAKLPAQQPAPTATPAVTPAPVTAPAEPPTPAPVLPIEKPDAPQTQPTETAAHSGPDLNGTWGLFVALEDGEAEEWERFAFEHHGDRITGRNVTSNRECDVTLNGMTLKVVTEYEGRRTSTYTGTLQPSYGEIAGTNSYVYYNPDPEKEDFTDTQNAKLVRLTDVQLAEEKAARELRQKRHGEAAQLFDALKRFAERNGGKFPGDLAQLSTEDLDDLSLLADAPGRKITYKGRFTDANGRRRRCMAEVQRARHLQRKSH